MVLAAPQQGQGGLGDAPIDFRAVVRDEALGRLFEESLNAVDPAVLVEH